MRNRLNYKNNIVSQGLWLIKSFADHRENIVASFEDRVDNCRKNETPDLIDNAAWDHAVYLFKNLLGIAADKKEDVRIISGHLRDEFYGPLSEEIERCIKTGAKIQIIVLKNDLTVETNKFASLVNSYENGEVITLGENDPAEVPHMLLIGDQGQRFRLETDHQQTKAVASFNNPSMGKMLLNMYNEFVKSLNHPASV